MSIDTKWTVEQARLILESVKVRLEADPKCLEVKDQADNITFTNNKFDKDRISLTFYKVHGNGLYLAVGDHWGRVEEESILPWKDKEYKALKAYFAALQIPKVENTSMAAILKAFPEVVNREFEKEFLDRSKDGK